MSSRWSLLLLVPNFFNAQPVCTTHDGVSTVQVSNRRGLFEDKTQFEQELLTTARVKLIEQTVGSNVQQTVHIYQEGSRTVYKNAQSSTYQVVQARLMNECYHITYDGRYATVVLTADLRPRTDVNITGPTLPNISRLQPTPHNPQLVTKISWAIGYVLLYIYSSQ